MPVRGEQREQLGCAGATTGRTGLCFTAVMTCTEHAVSGNQQMRSLVQQFSIEVATAP